MAMGCSWSGLRAVALEWRVFDQLERKNSQSLRDLPPLLVTDQFAKV